MSAATLPSTGIVNREPSRAYFSPRAILFVYRKVKANPKEHTDLLSSLGYLTLNTCIVASKLFTRFPQVIGRASNVLLNYMGVIELNFQWNTLWKNFQDTKWAFTYGDRKGYVLSALKTGIKGIDIILCSGLFAASLFALGGYLSVAAKMYRIMRPIGLVSYFPCVGLVISDYFVNRSVLKKIEAIGKSPEKIKQVIKEISLLNTYSKSEEKLFAMQLVRQLDQNVLLTVMKKLQESNRDGISEELWTSLKKGIQDKQDYTRANASLIGIGYISLGICRAYPNTLLQSSLQWLICLLYTGKIVIEKYQQELLRDQIVKL